MFSKKVLVAGAGKSGLHAASLLSRNNIKAILFDENEKLSDEKVRGSLAQIENNADIEIYIGRLSEDMLGDISAMVISPGIPVDAPFAKMVSGKGIPIISEIELAYMFEKGTVCAITGTNGKTTTTTLVGEIIKKYNESTYVVGNIGYPYTEISDKTTANSVTVAEISSFQLETIKTFKPHVSAVLNITPDHLDRHYTFENYANCKMDITRNQDENDYVVLNYDDEETKKRAKGLKARVLFFSRKEILLDGVCVKEGDIVICENGSEKRVLSLKDIKLLGTHNTENVLAAVAVAYGMGVPVDIIENVCTGFMGVEHRIEYVRTVRGVKYYNDSKGTNPDAAIKAIKAMTTTTFLIGGGYDKHSAYDDWIECFDAKVKYLLLIGQTAKDIAGCAKKHGFNSFIIMENLKEVVDFCYENAKPGDAVLLSPACASWGMFENYEQRGNLFKQYVMELEE